MNPKVEVKVEVEAEVKVEVEVEAKKEETCFQLAKQQLIIYNS